MSSHVTIIINQRHPISPPPLLIHQLLLFPHTALLRSGRKQTPGNDGLADTKRCFRPQKEAASSPEEKLQQGQAHESGWPRQEDQDARPVCRQNFPIDP